MIKAVNKVVVNSMHLIVGIDIGKFHNVVIGLKPDSRFTKAVTLNNNLKGYMELLAQIKIWERESSCQGSIVAMESTAHYWEIPARWLRSKGIQVVQVNALHTKRAKEIEDNSPGKTDKKDARIIAQLVRYGKYLQCILPEGAIADLRELVRIRQHIVNELTEKRNYLQRLTDSVFPELFSIFKKSYGKTVLHLLKEYPLPDDIIKAGPEEIKQRLRRKRLNLITTRIQKVCEAAQNTIGFKEATDAYRIAIQYTAKRILELQQHLHHIERSMAISLTKVPEARYILSLKGIGVVTAAMIVGETGGLCNYSNAEEVLKLAGLNLYEMSSGRYKGKARITKRGRPLLRHAFFILATLQCRKGMLFYEKYRQLLNRGMAKVKAIVTISRKLCRLIFALVRDKRLFSIEPPELFHSRMAA